MRAFGLRYFAEHIDEIVPIIKQGETIELVDNGKVIAHVVPAAEDEQREKKDGTAFLAALEKVAKEISSQITGPVDAVEIVRDVRTSLLIS